MSDTLLAVQERPLALPTPVVAALLQTTEPLLIARVERWTYTLTGKRKSGSSPNPAAKLLDGIGWTVEQINEQFPFPYGAIGDHLWIQEEFQRNFSGHVSHCGLLYRATDIGRDSNHGLWCYEKNGTFYDHYDRVFTWLPAEEMTRMACRAVYEIVSWKLAFQDPDEPGDIFDNPYCWHITLRRVE